MTAAATDVRWTETRVGRALANSVFNKHLVVLPNSTWPGFESDLMVVTPDLYLIDVEIKICRNDLKADAAKKKWVSQWADALQRESSRVDLQRLAKWPARVWKHYYALPKSIWDKSLLDALPSKQSGVLLLTDNPPRFSEQFMGGPSNRHGADLPVIVDVLRHAQPNTDVDKLSHEDVIDIARLSCLRMWDAFARSEQDFHG